MKKTLLILILISSTLSCTESKRSEPLNSSNEQKEKAKKNQAMMNQLEFSIDIKADKEMIWKALWDDTLYRDWSGVFGEGSHYVVDDWEEGCKIRFLSSDQSGIYSLIERHVPNKTIRFKHIGLVKNGEEQPIDDETKKWTGATESYSLQEGSGYFRLIIEIDVLDEHVEFMSEKLPMALEKIKKNSR